MARRHIRHLTDVGESHERDDGDVIFTVDLTPPETPGEPPTGTVTDAAGVEAAFSGWTGLLAVLYEFGQSVTSHDAPSPRAG
ncbi:MAG TPA: hypothetical protein VGO03_03995 [Acidimicrobiia bacterium]|jgi:hypothetical protein